MVIAFAHSWKACFPVQQNSRSRLSLNTPPSCVKLHQEICSPVHKYAATPFCIQPVVLSDRQDEAEESAQQSAPQQLVPQQQSQMPQQQQQEPAETDHWVQCDRCRTWRIVPDASWPSVEADTRESWFCEWATWDVRTQVPYNPSCMQQTH